jgi:hypothetical protein
MNIIDEDRIYFLLKDPHWAFTWWNDKRQLWRRVGDRHYRLYHLRIHDITDIDFDGSNSNSYFDIPLRSECGAGELISNNTDHWYVALPEPNRTYCAELCLSRRNTSERMVIARSNPLFVPRDCSSGSAEENWSRIEIV